MTEGVKVFLNRHGLSKYYDMFVAKGYDLESDLPFLTERELEDILMVTCQRDRNILLSKAKTYNPSPEHAVYEWLRSHSLDYYFISFVQSELADLQRIVQLQLPDEDLYDELEIMLPGHRKRLERAVNKLKHDQTRDMKEKQPVTCGWWGKPKCLPQAKFDFLCVRAHLFSSQEPQNRAAVDFMVDSGSDVSTVQESTLTKLNLELIGSVYSCGVHGGNHCNIYRARLAVGQHELEIEVMGSNYDSLGSRVVRNFRHIIDGNRHIWLPGNYKDPMPAIMPLQTPLSLPNTSSAAQVSQLKALPDSVGTKEHDNAIAASQNETLPTRPFTSTSDSHVHTISAKNQDPDWESDDKRASEDLNVNGLQHVKNIENLNGSNVNSVSRFSSQSNSSSDLAVSHSSQDLQSAKNIPSSSKSVRGAFKPIEESSEHSDSNPDHPMHEKSFDKTAATCKKSQDNLSLHFDKDNDFNRPLKSVTEKDVKVNQRVSLSHLVPAALRDTDDDVDHHHQPDQCEQPSCLIYNDLPMNSWSGNPENISDSLKLTSSVGKSDKESSLQSAPVAIGFASNFIQANNDAMMITLDDIDIPETPQSVPGSGTMAFQNETADQSHPVLCEAVPDQPQCFEEYSYTSPRKKFKPDNT